jgi:hypothetical protein
MNDTVGLALPICALSLVCAGLLAVIALIAVRFLGFVVPGWLSHYTDVLAGKAERGSILPPDTSRSQRADFRAQSVDLDFDAAVARHQAKNNWRPTGAPPKPSLSAGTAGDVQTPSLRRRRRRPREGYSEDEIHGGLLDIDGDGDPDI